MAYIHRLVEKHRGKTGKLFRVFGGEISACAPGFDTLLHFRVAPEVVLKALRHDFTLGNNPDVSGHSLADLRIQNRIVGTSKHHCVKLLVHI